MPFELFAPDTHVPEAGRWLVLGMFLVLGGVLGSFVNVVVYRLPRRMSLSHPGSRCPACGHPIRWYDNVPVVGWLRLRGRCRDCGAPISARYPIVEAIAAASGALVGWSAIVQVAPAAPEFGASFSIHLGQYAFQMLLVCTLVSTALIEFDGSLPPARLLAPVLVAGLVLGGVWPELRAGGAAHDGNLGGVYDGTVGLLAAAVLGGLAWPGLVAGARRSDVAAGATDIAELALVSVFLGAAAAAVIAAGTMCCYAALRAIERIRPSAGRFGWAVCLAAVTLVQIVAWPLVVARMAGAGDPRDWTVLVAAGVVVAVSAIAARFAGTERSPTSAGD